MLNWELVGQLCLQAYHSSSKQDFFVGGAYQSLFFLHLSLQ